MDQKIKRIQSAFGGALDPDVVQAVVSFFLLLTFSSFVNSYFSHFQHLLRSRIQFSFHLNAFVIVSWKCLMEM